jgi:hypothetical protein
VYDIKIKYNTKAADFYRRMNNAKALMLPFTEEEPSYEEGRFLLDGRKLDKEGQICEAPADGATGVTAGELQANMA